MTHYKDNTTYFRTMQNIYFVDNKLKSRLLLQYSYSWDNRKNQNASLALMENFSGECQEQILES